MKPSSSDSIGLWTKEWAERQGIPAFWSAEVGSTNDLAKDDFAGRGPLLAAGDVPLALYLSDVQTQGRGRGGSRWTQARPGSALLSTWSFATPSSPQPILSPLVGLSLFRAARVAFDGGRFALKAPNDLYLDGRKVAGVLIEAVEAGRRRRAAIGVGLNALEAPRLTDPDAKVEAIALAEAGAKLDRSTWERFLSRFRDELSRAVVAGCEAELSRKDRSEIREALNLNPRLTAPVLDVDAKGQLALANGVVRWQDL